MRVTFVHLGRENLGIEYISAVLKKAGHKTFLALDPGLFGPNDNVFYIPFLERIFEQKKRVVEKVKNSNPDIVAFSVYTGTYKWCCEIADIVKKELGVKIVFGGIHTTLVPEKVLLNDFVDFIVIGEGEQAMLELAEGMASGKSGCNIPNLWYKKNGKVVKNDLRPPANINSLPFPDKELFENDINYKDDYVIMTNRGCVFSCNYCCEGFINKIYGGKFYRRRTVDSVMEELNIMKKRYNFKEVMFNDALFSIDKYWMIKLLEKYKDQINVPFRCFGKVDYFSEEIAGVLKKSGCYCIEFGMQTLNESVKKDILGRYESNEKARKAFEICDKYKLRYDVDHMFGLPDETEYDHIEGARFYSKLKYLNRLKPHNLTYFPKLPIADIGCRKNCLEPADIEEIESGKISDFFHTDFIKNKNLRRMNSNFRKLYKILPIFPTWAVSFIIRTRLYRIFRFIPSVFIILGQILVAIKGRDYRYIVYLKYYPLRIKRCLLRQ
ncbi:MAG: cobalamin-dependent protein [Elusimicrobia bacterium]|nr:cobalamin-dependent protein [Elusimicrobiota bacterium]